MQTSIFASICFDRGKKKKTAKKKQKSATDGVMQKNTYNQGCHNTERTTARANAGRPSPSREFPFHIKIAGRRRSVPDKQHLYAISYTSYTCSAVRQIENALGIHSGIMCPAVYLLPGHAGLVSLRQLHDVAQSLPSRHDGCLVHRVRPWGLQRLRYSHNSSKNKKNINNEKTE